MKYDELKAIDKELAYFTWEPVSIAKKDGTIPKEFHEYFSDYCECGSENIIKTGATLITCCDPHCCVKQGFILAEMFTRYGIKGLKEASCTKIFGALKAEDRRLKENGEEGLFPNDSYVEVLAIPFDKYPISVTQTSIGADFFAACLQIRNTPITFPQLVSHLGLPELGKESENLFQGITNFYELYNCIRASGSVSDFLLSRGSQSQMLSFNLRVHMKDIALAFAILQNCIRAEGVFKLNVCMTGAISLNGASTTKDSYLKACNAVCKDKDGVQLLDIKMNSAKKTNPFILYSRESGDSKFIEGSNRGVITDEFGKHPVLMHTDTFYKFIRRMMDLWNRRKDLLQVEEQVQMFWESAMEAMQETLNPMSSSMTSAQKSLMTSTQKSSLETQQMTTF